MPTCRFRRYKGALSASPDQIAWIVTSNLIATAVTIPLAGWVSDRFGRRRCMIWGVIGFGAATLMCGLSNSLGELVFWRVLQSGFGSPLTPIAQSVVIDEFTGEKRGPATAIYSLGVGIAPTFAPLLGGYVSEEISWRWVFFILLPVAFVALVGVLAFIKPDPPREKRAKLDWTGFLSLAIAVACVQFMLDRGEREEWFDSVEIILEFALALLCGWIFLVHSLTSDRPFLDPRLLLERNFALGIGIAGIFGMLFVTPMVMMPAMLQQLRDVPEFTVGLLIAMRANRYGCFPGRHDLFRPPLEPAAAVSRRLRRAHLCGSDDGAVRYERVGSGNFLWPWRSRDLELGGYGSP